MGEVQVVKKFVEGLSTAEVYEKSKTSPYNFTILEDKDLYMLSFSEESDLDLEVVRCMNGVIFEKVSNKIIHYSFQKSYDGFSGSDSSYKMEKPSNYIIELALEGTHIKVYWYNEKWNVSTSRTINSSVCKWNSNVSFMEMFYDCLSYEKLDINNLSKDMCYSFIIQHPENKISHEVKTPYCGTLNYVDLQNSTVVRSTDGMAVNKTIEDVEEECLNGSSFQNYIVYFDDHTRVNISSSSLKNIKNIVNNSFSSEKIYIRSLKSGESDIIKNFYKSNCDLFFFIDQRLKNAINEIHKNYIDINVKKLDILLYPNYEKTLTHLHWMHRKHKQKITKDTVKDYLLSLNDQTLLWVLDLV